MTIKNNFNIVKSHPFSWFLSGVGEYIYNKESKLLLDLLQVMPAGKILQLGGPPLIRTFSKFHFVHYDNEVNFQSLGHNVCGDFDNLSLVPESFDIVVSYHLHEICPNFEDAFAESYNALQDEGLLVVFGFNPASLWGMQRLLGIGDVVGWCDKFYNSKKISAILRELNFTPISKSSDGYGLYSSNKIIYNNFDFLKKMNIKNFGAFYMLIFKKRSSTLTLMPIIDPSFIQVPRLNPSGCWQNRS